MVTKAQQDGLLHDLHVATKVVGRKSKRLTRETARLSRTVSQNAALARATAKIAVRNSTTTTTAPAPDTQVKQLDTIKRSATIQDARRRALERALENSKSLDETTRIVHELNDLENRSRSILQRLKDAITPRFIWTVAATVAIAGILYALGLSYQSYAESSKVAAQAETIAANAAKTVAQATLQTAEARLLAAEAGKMEAASDLVSARSAILKAGIITSVALGAVGTLCAISGVCAVGGFTLAALTAGVPIITTIGANLART